jgi:hypothetical protein
MLSPQYTIRGSLRSCSYCVFLCSFTSFVLVCFGRVYELDAYGACHMIATGFTHIPMSAGSFEIECPTWRPAGTVHEDAKSFFLGKYNPLGVCSG